MKSNRSIKPPRAVLGSTLPATYVRFVERIKVRIQVARAHAAMAANRELLGLYWQIGRDLVLELACRDYGSKVVERLASDLAAAFPGVQGFSARNLWRMRAFYLAYSPGEVLPQIVAEPDEQGLPQAVALLPWAHHVLLLERVKDIDERAVYARLAMEQGWSRATLTKQIATRMSGRRGKAITNFARTLPPPQSALAVESLKDPYVFDFLALTRDAREREVEQGLIEHVQQSLIELGVGFAFVGRQVRIAVDGDDYFLDLLLFHLKLRCGKMNFYLSAVDEQMRHPQDAPSIGLLLCRSKKELVVEYALRDMKKPIGVAEWQTRLVASLPKELEGSLPTVEAIERELA